MISRLLLFILLVPAHTFANPFPIKELVPQDPPWSPTPRHQLMQLDSLFSPVVEAPDRESFKGSPVLRVIVKWNSDETYAIESLAIEESGTENLVKASRTKDPHGSYHGHLFDETARNLIGLQTIGTGKEYRKLVRALTFRFPLPSRVVRFTLDAEHPVTGKMQTVLTTLIDPSAAIKVGLQNAEFRVLKKHTGGRKLLFNIYGDYYAANEKEKFFQAAQSTVNILTAQSFPGVENFEFRAVFVPSQISGIGPAKNLGLPIPERESFLGLYYPYWNNFGRWYHIVYPTRESRYRDGLAQAAYDFALVLVNDFGYWGVGNFREITALPAYNQSFTYLLLHELGHYFGLNEEYEEGGRTELEFAPEMFEPWSQNITFLRDVSNLKWKDHVDPMTPIPTPREQAPKYGAYRGGYAESRSTKPSHKPGLNCVMESGSKFCDICHEAILHRIQYELGESN